MKKKKLVFLAFATIAIALLLEAGILKYVNDSNTYRMSKVLLDRVITVLNKNDDSENGLIESLKDDYIVRAKAVSYIIDAKPQVEYDVEELQKIADLILVDEIHLFDKNGYIYSGTLPKYYGFSFDSGEQMEYFKPMLKNKNLTMCQDVTPNTAEGKELMYAITWNEAGTRMIQIGIEPKRLLKELKQNEISAVVSDMPVYKGIEIFVADSETKIVKGATDSRQIGVKLEGLVVSSDKKSGETDVRLIRIGGKRCKCLLSQYDDYIVAVTIDSSFYRQGNIFAVLIVGVYLVLASCCMFYMLSRVMKEKGIEELFYAVRRLKEENEDFVLDLAGFFEDIYKKQVEELEQLGIAHFYGFQSDPRMFYIEADCVVLPSYHEGMSNVLLEAADGTQRPPCYHKQYPGLPGKRRKWKKRSAG